MQSAFSPVRSGDYSHWKVLFDEKIAARCAKPNSFINGVSLFGDATSKRVFNSLSSSKGVAQLISAVKHGDISSYISSKYSLILLWVLTFLILIATVVLAQSVFKSCRRCWQSAICKDRPRNYPRKTISFAAMISAVFIVTGFFILTLTSWVYSVHLIDGKKSLMCDVWQHFRGHYFGSRQGLIAAPDVVLEWSGSQHQRHSMLQLANLVNPKPEDGGICMLCRDVIESFNGTSKVSLTNTLYKNSDAMQRKVNTHLAQRQILQALFRAKEHIKFVNDEVVFTRFSESFLSSLFDSGKTTEERPGIGPLIKKYADGNVALINEGIKMFQKNIDKTLGRDSHVLLSSYQTAMTSLEALTDVDYVTAKSVNMFDVQESSLSAGFLSISLISILLGISLLGIVALAGYVSYSIYKAHQQELPVKENTIRLMGTVYVLLILLSGLFFLFSTICLTVAHFSKDLCGFVDKVAFHDGSWDVLPAKIWKETVSGSTDVRTALTTCVADRGSGDIAAALGLRMSLDKLSKMVDALDGKLHSLLEEKLNLNIKREVLSTFADIIENIPYTLMLGDVEKVDFSSISVFSNKFDIGSVKNEFRFVNPYKKDSIRFATCATPALYDRDSTLKVLALYIMEYCTRKIFIGVSSTSLALNELNKLLSKAIKRNPEIPFDSFCFSHQHELKICDKNKEKVFKLKPHNDASVEKIFNNEDIRTFLGTFKDRKDSEDLSNAMVAIATFINYDSLMDILDAEVLSSPLELSDADVTYLPIEIANEIGSLENKVNISLAIAALFPSIKGNDCLNSKDAHNCTYSHIIKDFLEESDNLQKSLGELFDSNAQKIMEFVKNDTLKMFKQPLKLASRGLENFNCQFVGTALRAGPYEGFCGVIMPTIASIGIISLILWVYTTLGAILSFRLFHYYRNLVDFKKKDLMDFSRDKSTSETPNKVNKLLDS